MNNEERIGQLCAWVGAQVMVVCDIPVSGLRAHLQGQLDQKGDTGEFRLWRANDGFLFTFSADDVLSVSQSPVASGIVIFLSKSSGRNRRTVGDL